ncbi:MAG: hypothetical protein A2493_00815 [Candidatus Magasanikbacteria bacterium RIFOXYC12_FULL_33_11]|uniref:Type 4 fimbrial biogenesis protein PilX N-terminal domain-containing protein n=1 Tax=Candidatus Magasanikbacteria bacterium RIFOXYC12_FULL_33_11 TaxID=1798701 RepID=A0A1F6NQI1_9BACT|nr:MAG: hypothetical protein A2493_00815 [Candidatus Magasanikbacteria bacterium RIFOXYC12_FULL_33_11]
MFIKVSKDKRGIMAIMMILIIGAAALILALSSIKLVVNDSQMSFTNQKGGEAFSVAEGCLEESLRRLRLNTSYTGEILNLSTGSCIIGVSSEGNDRIITVTGTAEDYTQRLQASVTLDGNVITLNSRQEI